MEEGEHTITISASTAEGIHQWASVCDIQLLKVPEGTALEKMKSQSQASSVYNLQGIRQREHSKGIMIKDGRKVVER